MSIQMIDSIHLFYVLLDYGWVNAGIIPVHKGGKKLRFLKSEIDNWLKQGRKKTLAETASEAEQYCKTKKG